MTKRQATKSSARAKDLDELRRKLVVRKRVRVTKPARPTVIK